MLSPTWAICTLSGRAAAAAAAAATAATSPLTSPRAGLAGIQSQDRDRDGHDEAFLFATGGARGVDMWLGVSRVDAFRHVQVRPGDLGGKCGRGRGKGAVDLGSSGDRSEAYLLGTASRVKGTALASVGRFVVAADLSRPGGVSDAIATLTAVDATRVWVSGVGYQGKQANGRCPELMKIGMSGYNSVTGLEERNWVTVFQWQ